MKRSELVVGQEYAHWTSGRFRNVDRVAVLSDKPHTRSYGYSGNLNETKTGTGVLVEKQYGSGSKHRAIVSLGNIRMTWAEYEEYDAKNKAAQAEYRSEQSQIADEENARTAKVKARLDALGIEAYKVPHSDPERRQVLWNWSFTPDQMDKIIEVLSSK